MLTRERDLPFFEAGLAQLENYLLSENVFQFLGDGNPLLTLSGLLLVRLRLIVHPDQDRVGKASEQFDAVMMKWRSAWNRKIVQEMTARINQWNTELTEILDDPDTVRYRQQVQVRVMLQLLQKEIELPSRETHLLEVLDKRLETNWQPGPFIWETGVEQRFPRDEFWFLYGTLKKANRSDE